MKIQLPPFVLADLYKDSLVVADAVLQKHLPEEEDSVFEKPLPEDQDFSEPVVHLGGNDKKIAILVNNTNHRFIDDESLQLLINVLTALQLTLQDVAIFNINATPFSYKELLEKFGTRVCLMFHVSTNEIGLPFQMPDYKVQAFDNCKFLCSASLNQMKGNGKEAKVEKTKLWMCLKTIFE